MKRQEKRWKMPVIDNGNRERENERKNLQQKRANEYSLERC